MAKMNKLNKKVMVALVADFSIEDINKVKDLGNNKYQISDSLGNSFKVSFGEKRVIVTAKGCCWKRRDMTKEVDDILCKIRKIYRMNPRTAFREYFDLLRKNNCAQVVGCDEQITWHMIRLIGKRLKRIGFTDHILDCVCGECSWIADNTMYPEFRTKIDEEKIFNGLWKQAQEERVKLALEI